MVSLKKEPQIIEVTPVHLMDEEEAVRTYCPPKTEATSSVEILVKQSDEKELPAVKEDCDSKTEKNRSYYDFAVVDLVEKILMCLVIIGVCGVALLMCSMLFGDTLQLAHDLYAG